MTRRLATAAAAVAVAALAAPAGAEPSSVSNVVSTAAASGVARLDATCHFGPVVPDNFEDQMHVTGIATAPGAIRTTVRCTWETSSGAVVFEASANAPAVTLHDSRNGWRSALRVCVSAEADFGRVGPSLVAPKVCA